MTDNNTMRLWRAFEQTDPAHTKPVEFGRKFTSIDAHYQIMRVTEQLGPVGQGWGYDVEHSTHKVNDKLELCFADVTLWWKDGSDQKNFYGPIRGCAELYYEGKGGKMQLDDDAPKKSATDALTKGLSHLGVSADVFLGMFDDNKYVEKMKRRFAIERVASNDAMPKEVSDSLAEIPKCADLAALNTLADAKRPLALKWDKMHRDLFAIRVNERRIQLGKPAASAAA
jgi:hypothetical protein